MLLLENELVLGSCTLALCMSTVWLCKHLIGLLLTTSSTSSSSEDNVDNDHPGQSRRGRRCCCLGFRSSSSSSSSSLKEQLSAEIGKYKRKRAQLLEQSLPVQVSPNPRSKWIHSSAWNLFTIARVLFLILRVEIDFCFPSFLLANFDFFYQESTFFVRLSVKVAVDWILECLRFCLMQYSSIIVQSFTTIAYQVHRPPPLQFALKERDLYFNHFAILLCWKQARFEDWQNLFVRCLNEHPHFNSLKQCVLRVRMDFQTVFWLESDCEHL